MKTLACLRGIVLSLFLLSATLIRAHDLTTSFATLRFKPEGLELQLKIAADAVWPIVQATVAPGAQFVLEEFETVGKAQLIAFAHTMEDLTANGALVAPREIRVAVVEDNFVFTLTYPARAGGAFRLTEKYLKWMPPDYASRIVLLDPNEKPAASTTLHGSNLAFAFASPGSAGKPPVTLTPPARR